MPQPSARRLGSLQPGANATAPTLVRAVESPTSALAGNVSDWRVSLEIPDMFRNSPVLAPMTDSRMIFPFNPSIVYEHSVSYSHITPTHTNYAFNAFQHSQVSTITITGEFFVENDDDAKYWVAVLHFLRSMTKMFYGNGDYLGNPPPMSRLNGYGKHVLNNIPVLITNFTVDLPADVDYMPCEVDGQVNYVPVQSTISVSCAPNYARKSHSEFNLTDFANGSFVGKDQGFI